VDHSHTQVFTAPGSRRLPGSKKVEEKLFPFPANKVSFRPLPLPLRIYIFYIYIYIYIYIFIYNGPFCSTDL